MRTGTPGTDRAARARVAGFEHELGSGTRAWRAASPALAGARDPEGHVWSFGTYDPINA